MNDGEAWVARRFEVLESALQELGPSVAESFKPITERLKQTIIDTISATYSTTQQMNAAIASPAGGVAAAGPVSGTSLNTPGAVTAGGAVSATTTITAGTNVTATAGDVRASAALRGSDVYATGAPNFNITGTRVAGWWETATGRAGTASSSERYKAEIVPLDIDPEAILAISPVYYRYREAIEHAEWRRTCGPPFKEWNPQAAAPREVGMIAERLHEAGLWQFVVYRRDDWGRPLRDATGDAIPDGIHYPNWGIALQVVARWERDRRVALEGRVDALTERLNALEQRLTMEEAP